MLSENDLLFHQPDTNLDSFAHLLKSLAKDKFNSISGILNVHRKGRVVQVTPYDPIFKDHEALMVYAKPYYFEALEDFKWRPTQVLTWQSCATPVSDLSNILIYSNTHPDCGPLSGLHEFDPQMARLLR